MTMKHTPTPWEFRQTSKTVLSDGKEVEQSYSIGQSGDMGFYMHVIASLHAKGRDGDKLNSARFEDDVVKANAELIVNAVNNYHALESQVKELREAVDKTMNIICDHRGVFPAFRHFMEDEEIQSIEKLQRKLLNKQP